MVINALLGEAQPEVQSGAEGASTRQLQHATPKVRTTFINLVLRAQEPLALRGVIIDEISLLNAKANNRSQVILNSGCRVGVSALVRPYASDGEIV